MSLADFCCDGFFSIIYCNNEGTIPKLRSGTSREIVSQLSDEYDAISHLINVRKMSGVNIWSFELQWNLDGSFDNERSGQCSKL